MTAIVESILPACDVIDLLYLHIKHTEKSQERKDIKKSCTKAYFTVSATICSYYL
jgi:hypothetical protein